MATELEELLGFLASPSPKVTQAAVDIVRGLTGSEDGFQSLAKCAKILLPSLSRLLSAPKVSEPAAEALVNRSQNLDLAAIAKYSALDMLNERNFQVLDRLADDRK